ANLQSGQSQTITAGCFCIIGNEWNEDLDNGFRPAGLMDLSSSTYAVSGRIQDNGSSFAAGTATHSLTLYRHSSGALVFGAGSVQWVWGLDPNHDVNGPDVGAASSDINIRQATLNLLADMGVQPATPQADLIAAAATADTYP